MSSLENDSPPSTFQNLPNDEGDGDSAQASGLGIGLSNPHLFERERTMLDLINRMHNTG